MPIVCVNVGSRSVNVDGAAKSVLLAVPDAGRMIESYLICLP
jgi:hypothetical protein